MNLVCGPTSNLKSTNTHGAEQQVKELVQTEVSGCYPWITVLCCYILKLGLDLVTDKTWTTETSL